MKSIDYEELFMKRMCTHIDREGNNAISENSDSIRYCNVCGTKGRYLKPKRNYIKNE